MATRDCLVTNILQNIFVCVQQKKETKCKAQISSVEMEYSSVAQKN